MNNNYKTYIYIYKFIYLLFFVRNNKISKFYNLTFIIFIKIIIIFIYVKIKYIIFNNNIIKYNILKLYKYNNYIIKYYILNIKLHSKTTKKSKILSYKCYILSKLLYFFGLGKSKSLTIIDSIKKSKYNSLLLLFNINVFKLNLSNFYILKYKKTKCMIFYNNKNYKCFKNYFNIIIILLNIYNYNIKIYNNNINNVYKIIYNNFI